MPTVKWDELYTLILSSGFLDAGWSRAEEVDENHKAIYLTWLRSGLHADMAYLQNHLDLRFNPNKLHPGTTTVISVIYPWPVQQKINAHIKISAYALGEDYHKLMRQKIHPVIVFLEKFAKISPRFVVDSAPMLDRFWAWKAGLGFIGKNTMLIHPRFGSRIFIGHILTDVTIDGSRKEPLPQQCGTCQRCLDACPTKALLYPGVLDSRRCISFWTVESKHDLPDEILKLNPRWIFGCDICTDVCPYNITSPLKTTETFYLKLLERGNVEKLLSYRRRLPLSRTRKEKLNSLWEYYQTK